MSFFSQRPLDVVNERSDQIKFFLYSLTCWCSLFFLVDKNIRFKSLSKNTANDIKNRIISIIHGQVTLWWAIYIICKQQNSNKKKKKANKIHRLIKTLTSMSYFLYDLVACIHYNLSDTALLIHHTSAMTGYGFAVFSTFGGMTAIYGIFVAEISNFPMHLRIILRNINLRYTLMYELCEYTYFALYMIFRGLFFPFVYWNMIRVPEIPLLIKFSATSIEFQSIYYVFEMRKIYRRLQWQLKERKSKGVEYQWLSLPQNLNNLSYVKQGNNKDKIF